MTGTLTLIEELESIESAARALRERCSAERLRIVGTLHRGGVAADMEALCLKASAIYAGRRKRDAIFAGLNLFSDPAWDILLDLFLADHRGRLIGISSAVLASRAPYTTGLRWVSRLIEDGLIARESDPRDARRSNLHLTEQGTDLVALAVAAA